MPYVFQVHGHIQSNEQIHIVMSVYSKCLHQFHVNPFNIENGYRERQEPKAVDKLTDRQTNRCLSHGANMRAEAQSFT